MKPIVNVGLRQVAAHDKRVQTACQDHRVRRAISMRKYSIELLNEGLRLAKEIGVTQAARETGINYNTLKEYAYISKLEKNNQGQKIMAKAKNSKYTLKEKQNLVRLGLEYQANSGQSIRQCFKRAGHALNLNGLSILQEWQRGFFTMEQQ